MRYLQSVFMLSLESPATTLTDIFQITKYVKINKESQVGKTNFHLHNNT